MHALRQGKEPAALCGACLTPQPFCAGSSEDLERYLCVVDSQTDELNADGTVKRHRSKREERFFVQGIEISHTLARNGKELSGEETKKEQEKVDREVKKYGDQKQAEKTHSQDEKEVDMFLRALRFMNGQRESRAGRSTVVYDLADDPNFHPRKIEERFAQALTGRICLDEELGRLWRCECKRITM